MKQNREARNKPTLTGQLISDKGDKIYNGGRIVSSINGIGKTVKPCAKE